MVGCSRQHSRKPSNLLQRITKLTNGSEAVGRILRKRPVENTLESRWNIWVELENRPRGRVDDGVKHLNPVPALERGVSSEHFIENHAEAEDVRPMVYFFSSRLLRGTVTHRAVRNTKFGHCLFSGKRIIITEHLREPEVEHFHLTRLRNDDVCGLDIAMNDSSGVSCGKSVSNLNRN